ncbi:hypothetical protein M885DRAFT_72173 [Pelagophyceae sp. CCMP2097]|nr:hypothetical protein M885DRAFT_72173 [Pelagophyceae sp. CCMP2097]
MAGRGRCLSASGVDRGVVDVDGKSYTYAFHSKTWKLFFEPGLGGARNCCIRLLNGDFPDEATFARRISAACDRAAAKELAAAQATAVDAPSPLHTRSPSKKRVSELFNVSRDDVPASFPTDRPGRASREAVSAKRNLHHEAHEQEHERLLEAADDLGDKVLRLRVLKNAQAARAREAEAKCGSLKRAAAKASAKSLSEKAVDGAEIDKLLAAVGELEAELTGKTADTLAAQQLEQVPPFGMVGKGKGNGRGRTWQWWVRAMIYEQLANGTSPSAIIKSIVSDAAYLTPWLGVVLPTTRFVQRMRYELRSLAKALAAWRVAWS